MSWSRQLWHVLAKDLRAQRWWLLIYLMLLVAGTAPVWRPTAPDFASAYRISLISIATWGASLFACYGAFRADAPLGTPAYWVALPLSRSALFAAKLAFITVVGIILPLSVHVPAWLALDLPLSRIPAAWWESGRIVPMALFALALFVAGVQTGRATALLFVASGALGSSVIASLLAMITSSVPSLPFVLLVPTVGLIGFRRLISAFHRRDNALRVRTSLVVTGVLTLTTPQILSWATTRQTETLAAVLPGSTLTFDRVALGRWRLPTNSPFSLRATVSPRPAQSQVTSMRICGNSLEHLRSMSTSSDPATDYSIASSPVLPTNLTWRAITSSSDALPWSMEGTRAPRLETVLPDRLELRPDAVSACEQPQWYLLLVARDTLVATLSARDGTTTVADGRRFVVHWPDDSPGHLTFGLTVTHAPGQSLLHDRGAWRRSVRLVLVHRAKHEAISLEKRVQEYRDATDARPFRVERFSSFPGDYGNYRRALPWDSLGFASEAAGREWLRNAELHVIVQQRRIIDISRDVRRAQRMSPTTTPPPQAVP